jgi:hypothetical protein
MIALAKRFTRDERGGIALMVGLALPVLALAAGGGIDMSRAAAQRQRIASAVELGCQQATVEAAHRAKQSGALSGAEHASLVADIVNAKLAQAELSEVTVSTEADGEAVIVTARGASQNAFAGVLGFQSVTLAVARRCRSPELVAPPPEPYVPVGEVIYMESFEKEHDAEQGHFKIYKNWNGWRTQGEGIEINGIPELANGAAKHGKFFAELDSANNSAMWRENELTAGYYELSYWYISRVRTKDYEGRVYCAYQTDPKAAHDRLAEASYRDQTNRINVYFERRVGGEYDPGAEDRIDNCVYSDRWVNRKILLHAPKNGTYRYMFKAAGEENTYGGLLDVIKFCRNRCP